MRLLIIYISVFFSFTTYAQIKNEEVVDSVAVIDSLNYEEDDEGLMFALDEVIVFDKLKFKSYGEKVDYYILRRKVHKVYPYAKLASERLVAMNQILDTISKSRVKKKYIKRMQKYIEEEFTEELKKMTRSEGRILVKLIHRQTGETAFDLIKEYRSGWKAFWYNTTASMFDLSLKEEFEPMENHDDFIIEDILQRAFAVKTLEKQEAKLKINYGDLVEKWKK